MKNKKNKSFSEEFLKSRKLENKKPFEIYSRPTRPTKEIYGEKKDVCMGKIISKVPMQKRVIAEGNEIWDYDFIDGKTIYSYYCSFLSEAITKENAKTKSEIAMVIFAHKPDDFRTFTALVEEMLDKYAGIQLKDKFDRKNERMEQLTKDFYIRQEKISKRLEELEELQKKRNN